ncbi:hypothetical protein ABTY98_40270 [Streptomyces sp. NPDC096040]
MYYDAMVVHAPGTDAVSFGGVRSRARKHAARWKVCGDSYEID